MSTSTTIWLDTSGRLHRWSWLRNEHEQAVAWPDPPADVELLTGSFWDSLRDWDGDIVCLQSVPEGRCWTWQAGRDLLPLPSPGPIRAVYPGVYDHRVCAVPVEGEPICLPPAATAWAAPKDTWTEPKRRDDITIDENGQVVVLAPGLRSGVCGETGRSGVWTRLRRQD